MEKRFDIVSIGEILIDFVGKEKDRPLAEVSEFRRAAGGGPANVAVGASRLGAQVAFIGKVGADSFGRHLSGVLQQNEVNIDGLIVDPAANTTLVFVALNKHSVPDFSFFRRGTADTMLRSEELPMHILQGTRILHFSSVALTEEPSRSACLRAVEIAKDSGALISFDPNLRLPLWTDADKAKQEILNALALADIIKMNDDEFFFLTGHAIEESETGADFLWNKPARLLAVTLGEKGAVFFNGSDRLVFTKLPVDVADTTGAGDAFMAGMLTVISEASKRGDDYSVVDLVRMETLGRWANAAAALACTRSGGIPSLPDRKQVVDIINSM